MADDEPRIDLKILSPSTEIDRGISVPNVLASTTVKELRLRLQDEIPSRPTVDRMRLIYRGRVVANDDDSLSDVFGLENIHNSKEQTLHLVLRELLEPSTTSSTPISRQSTSPAPRSSTAPPNPFRPVPPPNGNVPTNNPFRPAGSPQPQTQPQPRPGSQPQLPHHHHHHPHPHAHHHHHALHPQNPFGAIPVPPEVNTLFQQHMAQAMANAMPQNNGQRIPTPNQQSRGGTPAPENSTQPSPAGSRPVNAPAPPGSPFNFPPGTTRIIRHEAIGPNGERFTTTINNTTITVPTGPHQQPILPRPFPHPPHIPGPIRPTGQLGDNVDQLLGRVRNGLLAARQEMDNVRVLFQGPVGQQIGRGTMAAVNPPTWRIEQIRQHVRNLGRNLDQVQQGLTSILAEPSLAQNPDVLSLQAAANELRAHAEQLNASLDELQGASSAEATPSTTNTSASSVPSGSPQDSQAGGTRSHEQQTMSTALRASNGPELFLLSSPQGPVGLLFDQRGTYTTAPLVSTLPFQNFTQQFALNRQTLAGLGQQMMVNQLAAAQPVQHQEPATGTQPQQGEQAPQNEEQNPNPVQAQNPAPEQDRLAIIAGHMWLLFKLACFVYIFAGGGGWYRPIMMGIVAAIVYLAQLGVFEDQFNRIRQHFEALLPMPEQPGRNQAQAQGAAGQAQGQQPRLEPDRNLTPAQAAQRILQQHDNHPLGWIRQRTRTVERAFALFVASLWPGLGERMVQAQEERERAERRAEEERERQEEERRQQEAEQAEVDAEASSSAEKAELGLAAAEDVPKSTKGKEKVEVAPDDGPSSS